MKRCYHCNKALSKVEGCNHLDCPGSLPNHAFCFRCQGPYPKCFCSKYDPEKPRINSDCAVCLTRVGTMEAGKINEEHAIAHKKTQLEEVPECQTCTRMWEKGV